MARITKLLFNAHMHSFANALKIVLERNNLSQTEFAAKTGVERSQLNRYCSGQFSPSLDILSKFCASVPTEDQARLVLAHIEDEIPEDYRSLVAITAPALEGGKTNLPKAPLELPLEITGAFEYLMKLAVSNPLLQDSILTTAKLAGYISLNEIERKILRTPYRKLERQKKADENPDPHKRKTGSREGFSYSESDDAKSAHLNEKPPKGK